MNIHPLLMLTVAAIALAGCQAPANDGPGVSGPPPSTSQAPTPQILSPGKFTFTADGGGTGVLRVPAAPVAELEELRELVSGEPVEYITASVDNRKGTESINMYQVLVFDLEGRQYTYTGVTSYIDELMRKLPTDVPAAAYNRFVDYSNKHIDVASPLEVKDFILVGERVPPEFAGVTVYATGGFNPVQAEPAK